MFKKAKSKKGFTLIELIVVIAILGILAIIAVPKLGGFKDSAEIAADKATARIIENAINLAIADGSLVPGESASVTATNGNLTIIGFTPNDIAPITNLIQGGNSGVTLSSHNPTVIFTVDASGTVTNPLTGSSSGGTTYSLSGVTLTIINSTDDHPTINLPTVTTGYSSFAYTGSATGSASISISGNTATFNRESGMGSGTETGTIRLTATLTAGGTHIKDFNYTIPAEAWVGTNEAVTLN
jgi:type IV pilus assembly protein PilA